MSLISPLSHTRFGSTAFQDHADQEQTPDDGVHLGDLTAWLTHNLSPEELVIAQQIANQAREEGQARAKNFQRQKRGDTFSSGKGKPASVESAHIPFALQLAKQHPGIAKLNTLIGQKIAEWKSGGKKPFHFFAELSATLRRLTGDMANMTEEAEDTPRRHDSRQDRRSRRSQKWGI